MPDMQPRDRPAEIRHPNFDEIICPECGSCSDAAQASALRSKIACPHCHAQTGIGTAALFDQIFISRKSCEKCQREFLIVDGVAMTEDQFRSEGKV
jgi:hypothetical protein